jgi:hypothetical protein
MKLIRKTKRYTLSSNGRDMHYLDNGNRCSVTITPAVQYDVFRFVIRREVRKHIKEGRYPKDALKKLEAAS